MGNRDIDVIIPVYKPGKELLELLRRLGRQTIPVHRIIIMNTEKKFLEELITEEELLKEYPEVSLFHLPKEEFDHGGTRRRAMEYSDAEIAVFMTQDAMPADSFLLEKLTQKLEGDVAAAYGRQLPRKDSSVLEQISREFNYPDASFLKGKEDMKRLGIKTFFCSNVCAAYRKEIYEQLGGFVEKTIFNEDMIYASKVVENGYKISYEAEARVIHSHNYSCMQQFHRNFDLGVSQAQYPEVFGSVKSESEGKKLVGTTIEALSGRGCRRLVPYFLLQCGFKYAGFFLGKHYKKLPKTLIYKASDNKNYWKK